MRTYLAVFLSLLVVLTGQGMAATRGMNAAVGHMVLCTGDGPVVVMVDENGQPTQAPSFCPDYALTLLGAVLPDVVLVRAPERAAMPGVVRTGVALVLDTSLRPTARGPPVSV